ncbi:hypothetical protein TeGR_g7324, partial [Tetraparma gracilis]
FAESPLLLAAGSFEDREVLLLAAAAACCKDFGEEGWVMPDATDNASQSCEFDAAWDSDEGSEGGEEEEEEEEEKAKSPGAEEPGFRILSLQAEVLTLKKRLAERDARALALEGEGQRVERESYNLKMNAATVQSELTGAHAKIGELEGALSRARGDAEEKKAAEARCEKLAREVKSVGNEKAVLAARINNLENKLQAFGEMQEAARKNERAVARAAAVDKQLAAATERIEEMRERGQEKEADLKAATADNAKNAASAARLGKELESASASLALSREQGEVLASQVTKLTTERNSLKAKHLSIAKDLARLTKNNRSVKEIEGIINSFESMSVQNSVLKAERDQALDEVKDYKSASEIFADSRKKATVVGEAEKALQVKAELERIISSLTEAVQTKEMQLDLMRDVNRKLAEELRIAREKGEGGAGKAPSESSDTGAESA